MRVLTSLLSLALSLASITRASEPGSTAAAADPAATVPGQDARVGKTAGTVVVGVSPFLDSTVKDAVFRGLVRLIVEDLPLGSRLEVFDAFNLKSISRVSIPHAKVFNSPKTRANQFASSIGEIKRFLALENPKPNGLGSNYSGAIRLPQFCDFMAQVQPPHDGPLKIPLLLIGSPLYQDPKESGFSMVDGYFPSDGHLRASREQSVFGFDASDASSQELQVYWTYFGDPWMSELHREKVTRFWALYLERRGGRLASFSPDLATAIVAFSSQAPGRSAASNGWVVDSLQKRPEMLRASRSVDLVDWLTSDALPETSPPPPSRMVGSLKIGIRWKDNIDLDLYASPRRDAETLFFQHPRSPEGSYFKDQRSSPGRDYEFIEFDAPVDVRKVRSYVNFYSGSRPGGPRGEVRIEFLNRIYSGSFAIASPEGNQGRTGASQAGCWTQIPVQEILRINEAPPQPSTAAK